jgi:hypothetical protein
MLWIPFDDAPPFIDLRAALHALARDLFHGDGVLFFITLASPLLSIAFQPFNYWYKTGRAREPNDALKRERYTEPFDRKKFSRLIAAYTIVFSACAVAVSFQLQIFN